ncbi:phage tail protein, partial [Vibrio sp. OPT18]|uniref:phage tail-collar fiber domain-containing protein n=1 Tax=Vibrio sp. OPT18 TaxID=2778641 RepID=UPI001A0F7768
MNKSMRSSFDSEQYAVLTDIGKQKLNALATGQALSITQLALGDGNGDVVIPSIDGTSLVNEIGREPITERGSGYLAAGIIMSSEMAAKYKGKWLREVGLFDDDGDLIVWARMAETLVSLFAMRKIMVHVPVENQDTVTIIVDTTKQFVTVSDFESFKENIQSLLSPMDYSAYAESLGNTNNDI